MKRIIVLSLMMLAVAVNASAKTEKYGKEITVPDATPVSAILDNPDDYIGKTVRVEGMVIDVCTRRGCWMYLAGDRPETKIQIKVTDGEIVFPMSASGNMAVVEGVVEELKLSREQLLAYHKHLAEEKGQPFDPSQVKEERMIRLRGIGAEIQE